MLNPWFALTIKAMQLGLDVQNVIALRMMRIASGDARGQSEARRMFTEKIGAGIEAQAAAASAVVTGSSEPAVAGKVLRVLRKRVRANKRRLSRR